MNAPRRHHFVSQMQLNPFTDGNGRLHFFDKRCREKGVLASTPAKLFAQRDLYTRKGKDGDKDFSAEIMFSALESRAKPIIGKIIGAARKGVRPNLTTEEKAFWDHFFFYQWNRVPDVHDKTLSQAEFEEYLQDSIKWYETNVRPLSAEEHERFNDPTILAQIRQNARVGAVATPGGEAVQILGTKGLCIVIIQNPNKSFVIGSNPVVKLTLPERSHLTDPSVEVWLPLAPDVAISPGFSRGKEEIVNIENSGVVRHINEATFRQSTVIAGRSAALIASLARTR